MAELVTEREAAQLLNISAAALKRRRLAGDPNAPPYVRLGPRTIRYARAELERFVRAGTMATPLLERGRIYPVSATLELASNSDAVLLRFELPGLAAREPEPA